MYIKIFDGEKTKDVENAILAWLDEFEQDDEEIQITNISQSECAGDDFSHLTVTIVWKFVKY